MGLLSSGDLTQMTADLVEVRGDNEVSVVIRRGAGTLAAQSVRVARTGGAGQERRGQGMQLGTQQAQGRVVVMGGTGLDIQAQDRFTVGGVLYEVVLVRPNRTVMVAAEARLVE